MSSDHEPHYSEGDRVALTLPCFRCEIERTVRGRVVAVVEPLTVLTIRLDRPLCEHREVLNVVPSFVWPVSAVDLLGELTE